MWTGRNEVSVQNFDRLGELGIDEMRTDLGDIKVMKVVDVIERLHQRLAVMNTVIDFRMPWKEEVSFLVEKPAALQGFAM
jgi:hypothetical protein